MNILKSVFNSFLPGSEKEIEKETETEPTGYHVTLYHIDGNSEIISAEQSVDDYLSKYFIDNTNAIAVPFGKNGEMVLYDPYITQPPTLYNSEASFQTQIDIYGPAIIFKGHHNYDCDVEDEQVTIEIPKTRKRKKTTPQTPRRKSARLSNKNKK